MLTVAAVVERLERFAPPALAADWDNVGLLRGGDGDVLRLGRGQPDGRREGPARGGERVAARGRLPRAGGAGRGGGHAQGALLRGAGLRRLPAAARGGRGGRGPAGGAAAGRAA